jgi:hypothetical protein
MQNSVGTNGMGNAITVISFHRGQIAFSDYFRNAIDSIGVNGEYMPVIAPDLVGFGQVRRFLLFDFKKKIVRKFQLKVAVTCYIEGVATADVRERKFIVRMEVQERGDFLELYDLSDSEAKLIKRLPERVYGWSVIDNKNILYDNNNKDESLSVKVYDMNLNPSSHPIEEVIKKNNKLGIVRFVGHPNLPFAIASGSGYGLDVINWDKSRSDTPFKLTDRGSFLSFSPDGKWAVIKRTFYLERGEPTKTYLLPVSEKYPNYFGTPILLLTDRMGGFGKNKHAWTTDPVSFVGSLGKNIYRWELTNAALRPESKDTRSYHDYIVEKDLENLTKQKKQGLGK